MRNIYVLPVLASTMVGLFIWYASGWFAGGVGTACIWAYATISDARR